MAQMKVSFQNGKSVSLSTNQNKIEIVTPNGGEVQINAEDMPEVLRALNLFLLSLSPGISIGKIILLCSKLKQVSCDKKTTEKLVTLLSNEE